jgi:hypothetical protein
MPVCTNVNSSNFFSQILFMFGPEFRGCYAMTNVCFWSALVAVLLVRRRLHRRTSSLLSRFRFLYGTANDNRRR